MRWFHFFYMVRGCVKMLPFSLLSEVVFSLCQSTNCQCDNSPTFVLQNSEFHRQNFAVQRLANCQIDSLYFDKVKPPPPIVMKKNRSLHNPSPFVVCSSHMFVIVFINFRPSLSLSILEFQLHLPLWPVCP